jgi:anti-sigma B factor antagonist
MAISVEQHGDVAVAVVPFDHLDTENDDLFLREVTPVLQSAKKLVLDLSRVQMVDSRGCGTIISCLKRIAQAGGDLKLCGVNKHVRTVFELIRLHRICEIHDTREQAVRAFAGPAGG